MTPNKYLLIVNQAHPLADQNLFTIVEYQSECPTNNPNLEKETHKSWLLYRDFLRSKNFYVDNGSAYRSLASQEEVYTEIATQKGKAYAQNYVAIPVLPNTILA